jgi:uncharacterized protein YbbK (DUF523 family)
MNETKSVDFDIMNKIKESEAENIMEKPNIVISECLNLKPVRYDGGIIKDRFAAALGQYASYIPVCPEVAIGLGVPREPITVVRKDKNDFQLVQPETGLDLTREMNRFSGEFLKSLEDTDGFLLKSKSPSCGVSRTKTYKNRDGTGFLYRGKGMFARNVIRKFPELPCEDEMRLKDLNIRMHFLTRVFSHFELRKTLSDISSMDAIRDFHHRYRDLIKAYSKTRLNNLDRIAANKKDLPLSKAKKAYKEEFNKVFHRRRRIDWEKLPYVPQPKDKMLYGDCYYENK